MARDRHEHPALARLQRPELRPWLTVLDARGQQVDPARVAGQAPVALVVEMDLVEIAGDRMPRPGLEAEVERPMAVTDSAAPRGQADPLGEPRRVRVAVHGPVDVHQAAAPGQEGVDGP